MIVSLGRRSQYALLFSEIAVVCCIGLRAACLVQDLLRKQEALRDQMNKQAGIMSQLSREVANIRTERNTLAAVQQALGPALRASGVPRHPMMGYGGQVCALVLSVLLTSSATQSTHSHFWSLRVVLPRLFHS